MSAAATPVLFSMARFHAMTVPSLSMANVASGRLWKTSDIGMPGAAWIFFCGFFLGCAFADGRFF